MLENHCDEKRGLAGRVFVYRAMSPMSRPSSVSCVCTAFWLA